MSVQEACSAPRATPRGGPEGTSFSPAGLARGLRGLMGRAQALCRLRRIQPTVQLVEYNTPESSRLVVQGVHTCKSPLCPLCAGKWQRTRSKEISQAIDFWGPKRVVFVTLTMRHHRGMRLALMHRLLRDAFGHLWSGRLGQEAAEQCGGKPETVRGHDRTWSKRHGWHPHLHSLFFLQREGLSDAELRELLDQRWPESLGASLRRFRRLAKRILAGAGCGRLDCPVCMHAEDPGAICQCNLCRSEAGLKHRECEHLRDRARRVFGAKLVPRHVPLVDAARQISQALKAFTEESIRPSLEHGVQAERMRSKDKLPTYLSKLGLLHLELTSQSKLGKRGSDGELHYGVWEVARLATTHRHELRAAARSAWRDLFRSSFGTQTITFSDRKALGLGPDPYAEGEPDEQAEEETSRCLFEIEGARWDALHKARNHGLLIELEQAHRNNTLETLPYVKDVLEVHAQAVSRGPPERAPPAEWWVKLERETAAERRGAAVVGEAYRKATAPPVDQSLFQEELRHKLEEVLGKGFWRKA